ncbi:MAG: SipW-dependent-type signal peptide-containing protein [Clostridia bacterium]|nr:SipW-dependent-type signal peptide-containing protein [Clostridia bacterium]
MTNKNTRRAFLASLMALLLCVSSLLSTTYAWFTDSVTSGNNVIKSGNLDIELEYWDGDSWEDVAGKDDILTNELWEPGVTEVAYLKVKNAGSLSFKYQLGINIISETAGKNAAGETFLLSDYIQFGVVEGINGENGAYANREDAIADVTGAKKISAGYTKAASMASGDVLYLALVVYMPTTVDNTANHDGTNKPEINLGISAYATQYTEENDSFGTDYDAGAWMEAMPVYTEAELVTALNAAVGEDILVVLAKDIVLTEAWTPIGDKDAGEYFTGVLDGNGHTISGLDIASNDYDALISAAKDATIKNLTVEGTVDGVNAAGIVARLEGNSVVENCVNKVAVTGTTKAGGIVSNVTGADAKIVNCTNDADVSCSRAAAGGVGGIVGYVNGNASVDIINCTNNGAVTGTDNQTTGAVVGYAAANSSGLIAGFTNSGTITGKNYVGDGHGRWLEDANGLVLAGYCGTPANWSEAKTVDTPAELKTTLTEAAAAGSGDNTIVLLGDIDMTDTAWTPISVDGYHGAGVVTVEGNGATIKGLDAPLFAGGFAGKSGIVIKDLTIADSTIVGGNQGGGAFIDCADSMHVITLENCHLLNSSVSGERAGGLIGWCSGYAKLNDGPVKAYVTISDCSVVDSKVIGNGSAGGIAGHPGASDYTYTTIEDCLVKNVDVISYEPVSSWRTGAIVGTANNGHVVINNVTVEDVTLTQDGVTATETKLYGRFVPSGTGTLTIDGNEVLANATNAGLEAALTGSQNDVYLPAGNYTLPSVSGKDVTIAGSADTVITVNKPAYHGSDVTFEGVTVVGSGIHTGVQHVNTVTYNGATIKGEMCLYGEKVVFNGCTFELAKGQYIWTYGAKVVEFNNCTFNTAGKAILIYKDGGQIDNTVTVKGCTFNATAGDKAGAIKNQNCAAIEIDNYQSNIKLECSENTYNSNFSGEWRIKSFYNNGNTVTVNGTAYSQIAIDGKLMTIDANQNVTVN